MVSARQRAEPTEAATEALTAAKRQAGPGAARSAAGPHALMALQRAAGNQAVNALMAARMRFPGDQARKDIDAGIKELRRDEPVIDPVEKGLKAAKALGIPVDLEGVRPPASALAVTTTGFGPGNVAPKKQVPPPKKTPPVSPLGKAAAKTAAPAKKAAAPAPAVTGLAEGAGGALLAPAPLTGDQLLQPPVAPTGDRPEDDPAFGKVTGAVKATGKQKRAHAPAGSKAKEAQDAAVPPAGDVPSQAKAAKADTMDAQRPGTFDKKAFITAVKAAIEAKTPKTLKEADNYKKSGKTAEVKGEVKGLVSDGKTGQAKDITTATEAPPDLSKAVPKPVTPMAPEQPGEAGAIPASGAVPKAAPPEQVNLEAGKHQTEQEMADADVSEEQLADSNEPEFEQALADKKTAAAHADTAPAAYRQEEQQVIAQGKADANAETTAGVNGMQASKTAAVAKLVADKGKAKTKDEAKRDEVTKKIDQIFTATETDVKKILDGIDPKVDKEFSAGEAAARTVFENYVSVKMSAYKKDRYGGWLGGFRWAKDKLFGMPAKVNEFYVAGRELYLKEMDKTISRVADIVGNDLNAAKARIAKGRGEIASYVKSLPKDLQKVGADATQDIGERFEQLESEVDSKQESLVDTLATKYVEARKGLDERIEELQAENRGLVDKAIGAIKAVINTIRELVSMLKNVLARAVSVVGQIIKHPVRFLGNLVAAVKGGILKFKDNVLDHLRKGLMSWLFGSLAEAGIEMPESFDLKGIIKLLASIFGLTWANIRNRIVRKIGEKAMAAVEKGVEIFQIISTQGIGGLWQMLMEKLGDIKEMILEQVKDFVITKIITAGITWLIGLLNPAAAFIKACKLIYDIVMFFVNNGSRIMKFVNTVLDSVADIVRGNVGGVASKIESVLGQLIPIIIGFLASAIGLGGIGEKIRAIVMKLQKPVNKAIDFVIDKGLKLAGPIIRGLSGLGKKAKAKFAAGKAWVKKKAEAGKAWAKEKAAAVGKKVKDRFTPRPKGPASPESQRAAITEAEALLQSHPKPEVVAKKVPSISSRHGVPLHLIVDSKSPSGDLVHVQTMRTSSTRLAGLDPTLVAKAEALRTQFVGLVTRHSSDAAAATRVGTFEPPAGATATNAMLEDFIRNMERRAIGVVSGDRFAGAVEAQMKTHGLNWALARQGVKGNPAEFANLYEYYATHFAERYEAIKAKQAADVAAGVRTQTNRTEAAHDAAREMAAPGAGDKVTKTLYADRRRVRDQERAGATVDPALPDAEVEAKVRAQAGQIAFGTITGAAYHARKHAGETGTLTPDNAAKTTRDYHEKMAETVRSGSLFKITPIVNGARQLIFVGGATLPAAGTVTLRVIVYVRMDKRAVTATYGNGKVS